VGAKVDWTFDDIAFSDHFLSHRSTPFCPTAFSSSSPRIPPFRTLSGFAIDDPRHPARSRPGVPRPRLRSPALGHPAPTLRAKRSGRPGRVSLAIIVYRYAMTFSQAASRVIPTLPQRQSRRQSLAHSPCIRKSPFGR
jgi:hypothetical protein